MREGWQTRSLGEVAAWSSGDYLSKANRGAGSVPVFGANGQTGWTEKPNITEGAIAVGRVGACGAIHSVDGPAWITDNALIVRPRENVNLPYLRLTLEAFDFTPLISGSNQPLITQGRVKAATVAIPPIEEQRRIVDLMSHVDDALRSCDALVSAEGALLDAASEALVFSPEFPLMKVGDLAEGKRGLVGGPFGSSLVGRDYVETGVPVIRGQNLQGRYVSGDFVFVSEEKSRSLHGNQATPGDVVFTQRGTLGQVSLIPDDAYPNYVVSQSQMRLTPDRSIVSADWVYHAFRTPRMVQRIKRADTSTANPHINLGILRTMDVPIPSVDMQAQVCSQLNAIEASIVAKMAESEALKSTRGALLSALLGGTHQIPSSYDEFIRDEGAA